MPGEVKALKAAPIRRSNASHTVDLQATCACKLTLIITVQLHLIKRYASPWKVCCLHERKASPHARACIGVGHARAGGPSIGARCGEGAAAYSASRTRRQRWVGVQRLQGISEILEEKLYSSSAPRLMPRCRVTQRGSWRCKDCRVQDSLVWRLGLKLPRERPALTEVLAWVRETEGCTALETS